MQSLPRPERTDAIDRLEARLCRKMGRTIETFRLIEPGDRIMVAMSGGKDSYALLTLLDRFRRRLPGPAVELIAFHLDQRQPGYDGEPLERWLENYGVEFRIHAQDTYSVVSEKVAEGRTYCSLCSRLRRGILYDQAEALGCSKIALGHHRDDAAETLLLNLFYSGQLKSMPPLLRSDDGRNVVIRPLMQCADAEIATYAQGMGFPILPCNLCGSQEGLKRQRMKQMLSVLTQENDKVPGNIAAALANVRPSHLHQPELYQAWRDFRSVESDAVEA